MADIGRSVGSQSIGLVIQTVAPGYRSSRRHRHVFQEEILIVMAAKEPYCTMTSALVAPGDCLCYRPDDPDFHSFENTGTTDLVIWAFGNRFVHEVCLYPDEGLAFVEGLGADVPLASAVPSEWTEDRRKR
jgi:uncharacterized cupin superfamily protein